MLNTTFSPISKQKIGKHRGGQLSEDQEQATIECIEQRQLPDGVQEAAYCQRAIQEETLCPVWEPGWFPGPTASSVGSNRYVT